MTSCVQHIKGFFRALSDYPPLPLTIAVNYRLKVSQSWCSILTVGIFTLQTKICYIPGLRINQSHLTDQVSVVLHTDSLMAATTLCDRRNAWRSHWTFSIFFQQFAHWQLICDHGLGMLLGPIIVDKLALNTSCKLML